MVFVFVGVLFQAGCQSCTNTSWQAETGSPTLANLTKWKGYLKVRKAEPGEPIGSTMKHISNVSHGMAVAKMNQALQSYNDNLGYKLSTVFELTTTDEWEQGGTDQHKTTGRGEPAVTAVEIGDHYYYIGFLDYREDTATFAAYEQTNHAIPAIVVVDGEDVSKPGWVRTKDEDGNQYHIVLHFTSQVTRDDYNIYRHLRNRGYSTAVSCYSIDAPTLEMNDRWRPFFTLTYNYNDGCTQYGNMYYPTKLIILDPQTIDESGIRAYNLDNPNTPENERDPKIDSDVPWVDQIYSQFIIRQYIAAWGYNPKNYGKTSDMDEFVLDGNHLDEVMDISDKHIAFMGYITSKNIDDSLIGFMVVNPRDGTAVFHETQGISAMATKTSAINAILQATKRWEYSVEDLTLHTIFGVPTWQGELTLPAVDNSGRHYGSLYCGMVMIRANYDHQPQHVQWATEKRDVFTKYERWLVLSKSQRVGSNVDVIKEITGKVEKIQQLVVEGNTDYLVNLAGVSGQFAVPIDYLGNPDNEDVTDVQVGDKVYMRYADPVNTTHYLVLEIKNQSKRRIAETRENEHM